MVSSPVPSVPIAYTTCCARYNVLYFTSFISILSNMLLFIKYNQISGNAWFDESNGNTLAAVIVVGG